jgi:hypothetical protein
MRWLYAEHYRTPSLEDGKERERVYLLLIPYASEVQNSKIYLSM